MLNVAVNKYHIFTFIVLTSSNHSFYCVVVSNSVLKYYIVCSWFQCLNCMLTTFGYRLKFVHVLFSLHVRGVLPEVLVPVFF